MKTRSMSKATLAVALLGAATAWYAAASPLPAANTAAPLRLCADPANLPFSSNAPEVAGGGAPGLYVEIGQAVAQALGRPMQPVWSLSYFGKRNLRATLLAGQCDFAVGLPAVEDFMGPRVIFTRPILVLGYALAVPKGSAVQFASPPQSLLAARGDITAVTTMDPEEAMRRLAAGEVDAAFVWGPSAGFINHAELHDAFTVTPVDAPQMRWQAAIGLSSKQPALRDEVDAVLERLKPKIRELSAKYAVAMGESVTVTDAGPMPVALGEAVSVPAAADAARGDAAGAARGDAALGKEVFNGTCAHCHGPDAVVEDRKINLRRLRHKYGAQMEEVFLTTVTNGRPAKGMPTWKNVFTPQDFANILAYLDTLQGK